VIGACDNHSTHTIGAFYEVYKPARVRPIVSRIEFHYTHKPGSWLNIAEDELFFLSLNVIEDIVSAPKPSFVEKPTLGTMTLTSNIAESTGK
jgi:hypothetical protein